MEFLEQALEGVENKDTIIAEIKKGIGLEFIPKAEFNNKNEELKTVKSQLEERDTQLAELKEKAKGNDELTAKIEELEQTNAKQTEELQAQIKAYEVEKNKTEAILGSGLQFHDVEIVKGMLDDEKDFKEQIKSIAEEKPFLIKTTEIKPKGNAPKDGGTPPKLSIGEQIAQARNQSQTEEIVDPWSQI